MTPVILHLKRIVPEFPQPKDTSSKKWTFDKKLSSCSQDFYITIIPYHPVLHLEYSALCHQIRDHLRHPNRSNRKKIIEQLTAALMMAELMEYLYLHYLVVPREVLHFRKEQHTYRRLLIRMNAYSFERKRIKKPAKDEELFLTSKIRELTARINWMRLFLARSKRALNLFELVVSHSPHYRTFIRFLDLNTNPFFSYLAWCFFIPRLTANLFLIAKHLFPNDSMDAHELSLPWYVRLLAQLQRRWFELANDLVWTTVGLLNCFLLIGPLAPIGLYLNLAAFAFDILNSGLRAIIELNRLYRLQKEYTALFNKTKDQTLKNNIREYQCYLDKRLQFEQLRAGVHFAGTVATFLAMLLTIPAFAFAPIIPFIGAVLLVVVVGVTYALTQELEQHRPVETIDQRSAIQQIRFFDQPKPHPQKTALLEAEVELGPSPVLCS